MTCPHGNCGICDLIQDQLPICDFTYSGGGASCCGVTDCDAVLRGSGVSEAHTATNVTGVKENTDVCYNSMNVEVIGNVQTSGTSLKTRLPLVVARCIWINTC